MRDCTRKIVKSTVNNNTYRMPVCVHEHEPDKDQNKDKSCYDEGPSAASPQHR